MQVLHFPPYVPYTLPEMADVPTPTAGDNGKALTYRSSLNGFVFMSFEAAGAVATHVGLANPHTQYLLASGYTANDVLAKLLTVDDNVSGLNATTLQGSGPGAFDAAGLAATAASNAATALAIHAGVTSGVHGIAAFGATLNATANQAAAQTALGLVIGTEVQAQNANLAAIAGLTTEANKVEYWTGSGAAALADFTAYGRSLVASANIAATGLLAADGSVTGATAQRQVLTNGITGPSWRPSSNSTTALQMQDASGNAIVTVNTTNRSVNINAATGGTLLSVTTTSNGASDSVLISYNGRSLFGYSGAYQGAFVSDNGLNKPIVFESGGTEKFRIGNDGNILVGVNSGGAGVADSGAFGSTNGRVYLTVGSSVAGSKYPKIVVNGPANGGAGIQFNAAGNPMADIGYDVVNGYLILSGRTSGEPIVLMPNAGGVGVGRTSATAFLDVAASTTARASLRIRSGARPTVTAGNPNDGEIWYDGTHVYMRIAGADKQLDN